MHNTEARTPARHRFSAEHEVNVAVSRVLLTGLSLAIVFMALGTLLAMLHPGPLSPHATPLSALPGALGRGDPVAFLSLGLVVLLATPALRVVVLLVEYVHRREWLFTLISLAVLVVLGLSVVLGVTG